eukprot:524873_1
MGADQSQWCGRQNDYYTYEVDTEISEIADQYQTGQYHRESTELRNRQQLEQLQRELDDALNEIQYMTTQRNDTQYEQQSTKRLQDEYEKYKVLNVKFKQQTKEHSQYKSKSLSLEQDNIKLKRTIMKLQDENTKLRESIQQYRTSQNTDDYYNDIKHENKSFKKQIKEMSEQMTMVKSQFTDMKVMKEQYEADNQKYKHQNKNLKREILALKRTIEHYNDEPEVRSLITEQNFDTTPINTSTKIEPPQDKKEGKRQRNRQRAVNELITTERTYIRKLKELNETYINRMKDNERVLKHKFHSILFPQILQTILSLNEKLLSSMEVSKGQIGSAMIDFIPYLKMYQQFINNHESATRLIKQLRKDKNSDFCKYLAAKEKEQNGFTLESYLILPIQRMPRYELCLQEIIKWTGENHGDMKNLNECYESISRVNKQINIRMKEYETRQRVYEIEERIINLNNYRLVQPSRMFLKQGYLTKVARKKDTRYLFILFNDLLIYCSASKTIMHSDKLILHQAIDITDAYFRIEKADKHNHNTFEIHSIEKSFLCYAGDNKEREEWIDAIQKCMDEIRTRMDSMSPSSANAMTSSSGFNVFMNALHNERRVLETAPLFVPNEWSDECMMMGCKKKFNTLLLKKRNHCQYCGKLVCDTCCAHTLPHFEPKKRKSGVCLKVCIVCYDKYNVEPLIDVQEMEQINASRNEASVQMEEYKNISSDDSSEQWEESISRSYNYMQASGAQTGNTTPLLSSQTVLQLYDEEPDHT